MKALPLLVLLAAPAMAETAASPAAQLTLDPALYAEALSAVQNGAKVPAEVPVEEAADTVKPEISTAPGAEDWQAAMRDAGTELADVRLLVLLQRLNPLDPPSARAEDYATALRLHHLMLAGNARACLELARACREGQFESGLHFIQSEPLAMLLEHRAAAFQLPKPGSLAPARAEGATPAGR